MRACSHVGLLVLHRGMEYLRSAGSILERTTKGEGSNYEV